LSSTIDEPVEDQVEGGVQVQVQVKDHV